jgi:hypothetical protein
LLFGYEEAPLGQSKLLDDRKDARETHLHIVLRCVIAE